MTAPRPQAAGALRGDLRRGESMARHTSWRVGGAADLFYRPADLEDLCRFLAGLPEDTEIHWLGLGSNLLVRDGGLRGVVICTSPGLDRIERVGAEGVRAEAGVASPKLARVAVREGLLGAEFLAGIPGSIGGALAMNAGAFSAETWERVVEVETVDRHGRLRRRGPEDFRIGYRSVQGAPGEWFAAATFRLEPGDPVAGRRRIKALLDRRAASQPVGLANAGSVFRNPPGDHAARLIEAAGLKGRCLGRACVSERHANFIINTGGASAAEVEGLIRLMQDEVARVHGVRLVPEVRILGESP